MSDQQTSRKTRTRSSVHSAPVEQRDTALEQQPARRMRLGTIVLLAVLAFLLIAAGLFAWNRWWRFDDAKDIQGIWHDSRGAQIAIDESRILLADKVIYDYEIDTTAKTVTYSFEDVQGQASYRFSGDRQVLVLQENAGTDWLQVLHVKDDPVLAGAAELPEGCTRLVRQEGFAQDLFDTYESKKQKASAKTEQSASSAQTGDQVDDTVNDQSSYEGEEVDESYDTDSTEDTSWAEGTGEDEQWDESNEDEVYEDDTSDEGMYDDSSYDEDNGNETE